MYTWLEETNKFVPSLPNILMLKHPILEGFFFFFSSPIYTDSLTDLRHSTVGKLEMLDLPSLNAEIQRLREIEMSEWIWQLRPRHPHWKVQKIFSPLPWETDFWEEPQHLWRTLWLLFILGQTFTTGIAVTELENLNAMGVTISWVAGICQRQGQYGDHNGEQSSSNQSSLTYRLMWNQAYRELTVKFFF